MLTETEPKTWDIDFAITLSSRNKQLLKQHFSDIPWDSCLERESSTSESIGLGFDIRSGSSLSCVPNIYLQFQEEKQFRQWVNNVSFFLNDCNLDVNTTNALSCLSDLCALLDIKICYCCGFMLARNRKHVKIIVNTESLNNVRDFLHHLNFANSFQEIMGFLEKIPTTIDFSFRLSFDVEGTIKRVAVECASSKGDRIKTADCEDFLSFLISEKMITYEKKAGILNWMGGSRYTEKNESINASKCGTEFFVRDISHFKLIYDEQEQRLQIKCYLKGTSYFSLVS